MSGCWLQSGSNDRQLADSTTKRSSGKVTLHESQNITHEYVKADSPSEEKMPSIMDLLNARGCEQSDSDSLPLPAVMQEQNAPCASMTGTMCPGRQQTHKYVKQDSMGVDDATKSVLSDVLAYSSTDESKNTPPLDFFAAAGQNELLGLDLCGLLLVLRRHELQAVQVSLIPSHTLQQRQPLLHTSNQIV